MGLQAEVMTAMKTAMKEKDQTALAALRAVKSELLLAKTSGSSEDLTEEEEIKILSKLVKQRKDSAAIFAEQNRTDLAEPELAQATIISQFLPEQLSEEKITVEIMKTIAAVGAEGMKDMGKVMGLVNKKLAGQADGKTISKIVKAKLS
ncbi:GatB/YqeY domain-containing protein [Winogradskyella bathintestinalis]|uniref:GatB/YqeY domain-containing protein n=1 Tax=Winogradskyella bathintestinalis TaxID=3035208 RepID=A0ABT7ZSL8_9FLAO|nr:GatB/YqeY domain-containing protein [Winogradskyella bathintestinalis]MDN3492019.1 GatB/YqeY domain-containing protein [Winogradskyella bathintestinalis]